MSDGSWFHARVEGVSRSNGKSAVGLVAYVTGQRLKDDETGNACKRNHPGEVLAWGTEAPSHAPKYLTDPQQIGRAWNDAQRAETRSNSHLANHENLALAASFGELDHIAVMTEISRRMVERYGVMVTWAVHKPTDHGDDRNWHGHLAYNMRRVTPEGFGPKAREIVAKETRSDERRWQRQMFADLLNDRLAMLGLTERVSPLSYDERGIDREPTRHLGNKQNLAELRGIRTATGDENRAIRERNTRYDREQQANITEARQLNAEAQIIDLLAERLRRLKTESSMSDKPDDKRRKQGDYQLAAQQAGYKTEEMTVARAEDQLRAEKQISDQAIAEKEKLEAERKQRIDAGDITDAKARYAQASMQFDIRRPYASLCDVAAAENAAYHRGQDELAKRAAEEGDPQKRQLLLLRKDIEHADYMAITSERLAGISYVITGRRDQDSQFQRDSDSAREWRDRGTTLREDRRQLQKEMDEQIFDDVHRTIKDLERGKYSQAAREQGSGKNRREDAAGETERKETLHGIPGERPRAGRDLPPGQQPERHQNDPSRKAKERDEAAGNQRKEAGREVTDAVAARQAALQARLDQNNARAHDTGRSRSASRGR